MEGFDSSVPPDLDVEALVAWLLTFSERWDFRRLQRGTAARDTGERARWLVDGSHVTPRQQVLIEESSRALGLIGVSKPLGSSFDYVLVLGGARLSCLLRPRLAAEIIKSCGIRPQTVVLLASARPVSESERSATDTYAPDAATEFDLINAGAEASFQMAADFAEERHDDPQSTNSSWAVRRYRVANGVPPIVSVSAPSSDPDNRRANSADTYEFFLSKLRVPPGSSLLLVTSEIYVPYQQLEAIRTLALPHGVIVETIGFPPAWAGGLQGMAGPANYLQEIRSTIQSAQRFLDSYPRTAAHKERAP